MCERIGGFVVSCALLGCILVGISLDNRNAERAIAFEKIIQSPGVMLEAITTGSLPSNEIQPLIVVVHQPLIVRNSASVFSTQDIANPRPLVACGTQEFSSKCVLDIHLCRDTAP